MSTSPATSIPDRSSPSTRPGEPVVQILGGGLAGLATAYHARQAGLEAHVYEAAAAVGGNARTLRFGDFLVDTGAHRLHDKDPEATATFRTLLGDAMHRVEVPSQIYWNGRWVAFPLRPLNAALRMGPARLLRILAENIGRTEPPHPPGSFEALALRRYGPTLAHAFLLNYSEKLWGVPTDRLDARVAGSRLKGLTLGTLVREMLLGVRRATSHLDGAFYYPAYGFGMLADALAGAIGYEHLHTNARITRIRHDGRRVTSITVGDGVPQRAGEVVSTIPLPLLTRLMDPAPPEAVRRAAGALRYRHLRLCIVGLRQPSISPHASLYFPERELPFTRLYEPRNRSPKMAPPGRTAAVLEVPCFGDDCWWTLPDERFQAAVLDALRRTNLPIGEVLQVHSLRMAHAYPVLEVGSDAHVQTLLSWAESFENLTPAGRAGTFRYLHTHDLFAEAKHWAHAAALRILG